MEKTHAADSVAQAFRRGREAKGWSLDEATFQARIQFPNFKIGRGQIVRYERGDVDPHRRDISVVVGLAALYDVELSEVAPQLVEELNTLAELAGRGSPCFPTLPPDGGPRLLQAA